MRVVRTSDELDDLPRGAALVPTMGALHRGHLSIIGHAGRSGRPVVVSIFVNPTQFGPGEDFPRYPRRLAQDLREIEAAGADAAFAPEPGTIYPPGAPVPVPRLPEVAVRPGLEDTHRPGHFAGVCQVVARLFDLVRPRLALFGEKDYQQLLVIRALAEQERGRWGDLEVLGHPTVREPDGLALSSRNELLDEKARARARGLFRALQVAHAAQHPRTAEVIMRDTLAAHDLEIDYAVVRDAVTLLPAESLERPARALVAARTGGVRLIDNMAMTLWR